MGLHTDVKKHLRERFPDSVNDDVPSVACDVCITDMMWILFRFNSLDDQAVGEDLLEYMFWPIERFFLAGGKTYVCCFDLPKFVPNAKAEVGRYRFCYQRLN